MSYTHTASVGVDAYSDSYYDLTFRGNDQLHCHRMHVRLKTINLSVGTDLAKVQGYKAFLFVWMMALARLQRSIITRLILHFLLTLLKISLIIMKCA